MTMSVALQLTLSLLFLVANNASEESVNLCASGINASYVNYTTIASENCGCESKVCLQKCCQDGFYHYHFEDYSPVPQSICIKHNSTSFNVPIYKGEKKKYDWNNSFIVGMLQCGNAKWQYFKMNNSDPKAKFYIQENGSLYYPQSNRKIFNRDRYCVDEEDGLTIYLCYPNEGQVTTLEGRINSMGKTFFLFETLEGIKFMFLFFNTVTVEVPINREYINVHLKIKYYASLLNAFVLLDILEIRYYLEAF